MLLPPIDQDVLKRRRRIVRALNAILPAGVIADERAMALLVASEEMAALSGLGVLMSISDGELCSTGELGTVVQLPGRRRAGAERSGR
jgi:hypothetical protein